MPEEDQKKDTSPETNISPAPTEVAGDAHPAEGATPPPAGDPQSTEKPTPGSPLADPLSDGTVPTVLSAGSTHKSVSKGKASLTSVYRRADILTTLFTFGAAIIAAALILGIYAFVVSKQAKTKTPLLPSQVSNLSAAQLSKLNDFFGGNTAGSSSEVLTVNSSSLFNGRVAVNSDLKVVGGADVSGSTSLANLTVNGTSTLGVTGLRGALTVAGPTTIQGALVVSSGLTVTGNVTSSGNGSFGGVLSAGTINAGTSNVTGAFNLSSHLSTNGSTPSISSGTIGGDDDAGTISSPGTQATITFHTAYTKLPIVVLTPTNSCPGAGQFYVQDTGGSGFTLHNPADCPSFNYWVAQ